MAQTPAEKYAELSIKLKRRYQRLWREVRSELARADAENYQDTAGETHDAGDQSVADVVVDVNLADVHRDIGEMREIEAALGRLVEGSYGTCIDCGGEIPVQRLYANPAAARCAPCQTRYEQLHVPSVGPSL
ncbi:TraR/DksA family transcriptional regulator [Fontimonas sp. SYSU GA230001]|uniref:TraR/DksA family transcriptional regulator n=1 Tax=Fontimonas sp. SYSU GA230001 TaxID=3142450 RepID=UPI0032B4E01F